MQSPVGIVERAILAYSINMPRHPGKWRVVDLMVRVGALHRKCRGRECVVERNGVRWNLSLDDWVQRTVYLFGEWDSLETDYIIQRLTPGAVFLDVGAHFGYYSLMVARHHGNGVTAYAFEPVAANYRRLSANIALNGYSSITPIPSAVGETEGHVAFAAPPAQNQGSGHVIARNSSAGKIPLTSIDAFVEARKLQRLDVLKMDIEGMELAALRGADRTLRRFMPDIVVELNPSALVAQNETPSSMLELLSDLGYQLYENTKRGLRAFDRTRLENDEMLRSGYTNLICRGRRPTP